MADYFISYSRIDKSHVKKIHDELVAKGKETWVDWEGIAPSEEWMEAIYRAIDEAEVFIFALTPNSLGSDICLKELYYAEESGKKVIPIVFQDMDEYQIPETLSKRNYIYFDLSNDLDTGVADLVRALDSDYQHIREHTELLKKAREWSMNQFRESYLLRGEALVNAETWLVNSTGKYPFPSKLHKEFIFKSRAGARGRQHLILVGVSVMLVLALVLALLVYLSARQAMTEREDALHARNRAENQQAIAENFREKAEAAMRLAEARQKEAEDNLNKFLKQKGLTEEALQEIIRMGREKSSESSIRQQAQIEAAKSMVQQARLHLADREAVQAYRLCQEALKKDTSGTEARILLSAIEMACFNLPGSLQWVQGIEDNSIEPIAQCMKNFLEVVQAIKEDPLKDRDLQLALAYEILKFDHPDYTMAANYLRKNDPADLERSLVGIRE